MQFDDSTIYEIKKVIWLGEAANIAKLTPARNRAGVWNMLVYLT
jgi:hypothetical protein